MSDDEAMLGFLGEQIEDARQIIKRLKRENFFIIGLLVAVAILAATKCYHPPL